MFQIKYPQKYLPEILRQTDTKLKPYCICNSKFEENFLKQSKITSSLTFFKSKQENENHIVSAASVQDNLQHVCFVYSSNDYLTNTKNAVLRDLINLLEWSVFVLKIEPVII